MRIVFTHHAEKKIEDLEELGLHVEKSLVRNILKNPIHVDTQSDYPNKIAEGVLDEEHVLRIVFREEDNTFLVITFYPARKGRYP